MQQLGGFMSTSTYSHDKNVGSTLARLRSLHGITQSALAKESNLDQSRISCIENGDATSFLDIDNVLEGLSRLGSQQSEEYRKFLKKEWNNITPPSFWNPQRHCLEKVEITLGKIKDFLVDESCTWPLRRQIERHSSVLVEGAAYLDNLNHNIAFIGDIGVGKSTAISFIFDLLIPPDLADKVLDRTVLETGAGGTTICEVHVKNGPEFGISIVPMSDSEFHELIADFCAAKWLVHKSDKKNPIENIGVSREHERAIRNMAGVTRKRENHEGKITYSDPIIDLIHSSCSENEFRSRIIGKIELESRNLSGLWYDSASRKHPMHWITENFKAVNNGRLKEFSLPKSIDLIIPDFARNFGELSVNIIDTKGVDDIAVREDLDLRLRDSRTAIIFCSRFNDAPGTSAKILLQHMQKTFSENLNDGKVSVLSLPRAGEARSMKDDMGELALSDEEGYSFKSLQVSGELAAEGCSDVPVIFYNVENDDSSYICMRIYEQLMTMRNAINNRVLGLCDAVSDILENHEKQAMNAAMEEVANRLVNFLNGNCQLGPREQLAYSEAVNTVKNVRYASTLWASTRRKGEYGGMNILHLIGVGAARDAVLRTYAWFHGLDSFVKAMQADDDLQLASRSIEQILVNAHEYKRIFLDTVQRNSIELYREPLLSADVWSKCANEWGQGSGFKYRVAEHLAKWFNEQSHLRDSLEKMTCKSWERLIISPMLQLANRD